MNNHCIRLRDLHKSFESPDDGSEILAVGGINLDIRMGEIVALLGPNGAGKTTTLDMVLGFTKPTAGSISIFDQTPSEAIIGGRIAAVLQTGGLLRDLTVQETIALIASTHDNPMSVEEALERAGLTDLASRRVQACSGGEQQRLRFALALLGNPDLLILDEPTTGMDVEGRRAFWDTMQQEVQRGRTVVFATHYLQEAEDFAQRTVLMANGKIVADGPTDDVRRQASGRKVRARFSPQTLASATAAIIDFDGVRSVDADLHGLVIDTTDSDNLARLILQDLGGTDLEIESASLENAFVQLTSTETEPTR